MRVEDFEQIVSETKSSVLVSVKQHLNRQLYDYIDDVVQETYLQLYQRLERGKVERVSSLKDYVYIVAKNESIRVNKRERKYIELTTEQASDQMTYFQTGFSDVIEIIEALPRKYKDVAELFYVKKSSLKEISEALDIKIGAIKSRLFRARNIIVNEAKRQGL